MSSGVVDSTTLINRDGVAHQTLFNDNSYSTTSCTTRQTQFNRTLLQSQIARSPPLTVCLLLATINCLQLPTRLLSVLLCTSSLVHAVHEFLSNWWTNGIQPFKVYYETDINKCCFGRSKLCDDGVVLSKTGLV